MEMPREHAEQDDLELPVPDLEPEPGHPIRHGYPAPFVGEYVEGIRIHSAAGRWLDVARTAAALAHDALRYDRLGED